MSKYTIVSVDMFGTLVDYNSIAPSVWKVFLKESYTDELAKLYWERANQLVFKYLDQAIQERRFCPPEELFELCYSELFPKIGLDLSPVEAAQVLAYHHSLSTPFPDAILFLELVGRHCRICLSSDTSENMLGWLRYLYQFDNVFTSEKLASFKVGAEGKFFKAVVNYYQEYPANIVHIGDSLLDIVGAHEAGITACWLNRDGKIWSHEVKPDYQIRSLSEAASALGIGFY